MSDIWLFCCSPITSIATLWGRGLLHEAPLPAASGAASHTAGAGRQPLAAWGLLGMS